MKIIKKKIKSILPTLKEKKRYLVFEIISDNQIKDFKAISEQILNKSLELLGQLGVAKAGIQILPNKWNMQFQRGLIRVHHTQVNELKSALTLIEKINNKKVIIKSIGVSGILNKAEQKYLR